MSIAAERDRRKQTRDAPPTLSGRWLVEPQISSSAGLARKPATLAAEAGLIALMAVGSVLMWIGVPLGLVWLASHLQNSAEPSMGPYLFVALGLPTLMVPLGKALASLDRAFLRVSGDDRENQRVRLPWHKSLSDARGSRHRLTVLDVVMIASVTFAGVAFLFWFLFLAGSSLPQ
jgi:hypothetical protein